MLRTTLAFTVLGAIALVASIAIAAAAQHQGSQRGESPGHHQEGTPAEEKGSTAPALHGLYVLDTCPVSGQKLGAMGEPVVKEYGGREVRFCCEKCVEPFEKEQERFTTEIDARLAAIQIPLYPIETCVISGQPLGSMGDPVNHVHGNRLVRFCCGGCLPRFRTDPAKFIAVLDTAVIEKQAPGYEPKGKCVVSGEPLDAFGEPVDLVVAGRLVRFCCTECLTDFRKSPARYLAAVEKGEVVGDGGGDHGPDEHHGGGHGG